VGADTKGRQAQRVALNQVTVLRRIVFPLVFLATVAGTYALVRYLMEPLPGGHRRFELLVSGPAPLDARGEGRGGRAATGDALSTGVCEIYNPVSGARVATVTDARFQECGVLTGDYDQKDPDCPSFIDYENGWERGQGTDDTALHTDPEVVVNSAARHFGTKGIEITNAFGPSRNFRLEPGRDYVFSAWIKPLGAKLPLVRGTVIDVDYRKPLRSATEWPLLVGPDVVQCSGELQVRKFDDGWSHVRLPVPASKDLTPLLWKRGWQYARVYVGVPNGDGAGGDAILYVDDIRFYPADSKVHSYYHDRNSASPDVCVGPENVEVPCR